MQCKNWKELTEYGWTDMNDFMNSIFQGPINRQQYFTFNKVLKQ